MSLDTGQDLHGLGADEEIQLGDLLRPLLERWRLLVVTSMAAGVIGYGGSFLVTPTFSAKASFLAPQAQGAAAAALASLGNLASLAGGAASRTTADQYASLMMSATVADRMIEQFDLIKIYDVKMWIDARRELESNTRIGVGKKDGLITVEVDDVDPARAAEMANRYIDELRTLTSRLALSEAQQRRVFFEGLMTQARDNLLKAELALQGTGFNQGALRAEPRAAAETYARLKAEVSAAEVRVQTLRRTLTDGTPEVLRAQAQLSALRAQLRQVERAEQGSEPSDYLAKYREFKYQETLFELFARQFEVARVDEARDGLLVQVVDVARAPERKSRPRRAAYAAGAAMAAALALSAALIIRSRSRSRRPTTDRS